jgi:peptide deformylase
MGIILAQRLTAFLWAGSRLFPVSGLCLPRDGGFRYYYCMEVLRFVNDPGAGSDQTLRQKAKWVKDINMDIKKTVRDMIDTMQAEKGVGLACPQIGLALRIFVTQAEGDGARAFINPTIIWTSQEQVKYEEGCLSLPGIYADVTRPAGVKVQAWNEEGRAFTLEASGMLARVIQHEYDHLEGVLFVDRIGGGKREKILEKITSKQKAKQEKHAKAEKKRRSGHSGD